MKIKLLLFIMLAVIPACAVVQMSANGVAYGIFTGGLFDWYGVFP